MAEDIQCSQTPSHLLWSIQSFIQDSRINDSVCFIVYHCFMKCNQEPWKKNELEIRNSLYVFDEICDSHTCNMERILWPKNIMFTDSQPESKHLLWNIQLWLSDIFYCWTDQFWIRISLRFQIKWNSFGCFVLSIAGRAWHDTVSHCHTGESVWQHIPHPPITRHITVIPRCLTRVWPNTLHRLSLTQPKDNLNDTFASESLEKLTNYQFVPKMLAGNLN